MLGCGGGDDPDPVQPDAGEPDALVLAEQTNETVMSGNLERSYVLYVPRNHDPNATVPLVLDLHGSGSFPDEQLIVSQTRDAADAEDFILAVPSAIVDIPDVGLVWNVPVNPAGPDDVQFISDVIDDVRAKHDIDTARVHVTGYSGGARMATLLACELDEKVASVAAIGGLRFYDAECADTTRNVPVVAFHGTGDPVNPYDGNGQPGVWDDSVEDDLADWAAHHGCDATPTDTQVSANVTQRTFENCNGTSPELYTIADMGHTWPGSPAPFPAPLGPNSDEIDATGEMAEFFNANPLP